MHYHISATDTKFVHAGQLFEHIGERLFFGGGLESFYGEFNVNIFAQPASSKGFTGFSSMSCQASTVESKTSLSMVCFATLCTVAPIFEPSDSTIQHC